MRRFGSSPRRAGTAGASTDRNSRAQPAAAAGLSPGQVSRLALKWTFGFPGATALYGQTVIDGRFYVTSNAGYVYSLDADTGLRALVLPLAGRRAQRLHRRPDVADVADRLVVYFGDIHGMAYALDASTGEVIWKMQTDPHPLARITGTPVLHEGRVYVPVASLEEPESGQADYGCCTFRGYLVGAGCRDRRTDLEDLHRFLKSQRSSARTHAARTCSRRPVPASGSRRSST